MGQLIQDLMIDLQKKNSGHIFYLYENRETYLKHVVSFIASALYSDNAVIILENERNIRHIDSVIKSQFNKDDLKNVHFMNNFDFYSLNGNFHWNTLYKYFLKMIEPFLEQGGKVCTWGLVEWREDEKITESVHEYEQAIDMIIHQKGIISVCAYDGYKTSDTLRGLLERCHDYMITDEEVKILING